MESESTSFLTNPTFWVGVAFAIFVGLVFWKRVPSMIAKALDERAEKIQYQIGEARNLKEEAQSLLAQYQRKHRDAKKDAEAMKKQAKEEADLFGKEAEKHLEAAFERQMKATEEKISQAEATAVREVKAAATEAAIRAATGILEDRLEKDKSKKLVDEAIKDLDKHLH